ncbi:hypothetical protein RM697_11285 [Ichthyenterobacterium sp. W332]|uniref:Right handed beta helix domain-containing protein n=1 Tax=Microcosmobacter mediterraneus TaxID=3075607 RepID=A0ABU2YM49_9FLAO|nr:hypothetical protein [Ichthyenterobacterium sp. W332]MDT0559237.1 hypothetical protein [Ichthyenterobacterium sp. W332]
MKLPIYYIILLCFSVNLLAQNEYHVFPVDDLSNPGTLNGNGTIENPWDLQSALNHKEDVIKGGDIIWIHQGVYNGRYTSTLESNISDKKITVSAFRNDKVVLNGNVESRQEAVLTIYGANVIYKNFEITCLGDLPRSVLESSYKVISGLNHITGKDCEFINLRIFNNTGFGFGSWKHAEASIIEECVIYNNGSVANNGKGRGEGIYTQNKSDKTRIIQNNIIFNNYYKAIEVWSANKHADYEYVKHFNIDNNILFNSGLPAGFSYDNLIIATDDREGINIAKDISVTNNIFYHNTDIKNKEINGNAPSLTLGFHKNAPVEDIRVENNVIIGRNNSLRIINAKSLLFKNNFIYSGYIHNSPYLNNKQTDWHFENNSYFTKRSGAFRFHNTATYSLKDWQNKVTSDVGSTWSHIKYFEAPKVLDLYRSRYNTKQFRVTLFDKLGDDVIVDFSEYSDLNNGRAYKIKNIETSAIIAEGVMDQSKQIVFEIGTYNNTNENFGVFFIEFEDQKEAEKRKTILGKFFKWLGF